MPFTSDVDLNPIAVNWKDLRDFGCPHCGYRSGYSNMSAGGASTWTCGECGRGAVALADELTKSPIGIGYTDKNGDQQIHHPELQEHPRKGTPAHGKPDKRPEDGGDFFSSRGVGMDRTPGCFVCGGGESMRANISGYVLCKESGERVVAMFDQGARLDWREYEPDYVQVKIGACNQHKSNLQRLHDLTRKAGGDGKGIITEEIIHTAKV